MSGAGYALLTRPAEESSVLARRLAEHGRKALIAPVLEIHSCVGTDEAIARQWAHGVRACLATSRHALPALAAHTTARTLPLYVVGEASAAYARALGFGSVTEGGGTVPALADSVATQLIPGDAPLLYVRGREISADLAGMLGNRGFRVAEVIAYEARARKALPESARQALTQGEVALAAVYSRRSLAILESLIRLHALEAAAARVTLVCFSEGIAVAADGGMWGKIRISAASTEQAMLEALV